MRDSSGIGTDRQAPSSLEQATLMFRASTEGIRQIEKQMPLLFEGYHDARKKYAKEGVQAVLDMTPPMEAAYDKWLAYENSGGARPGIEGVLDRLDRIES